MVNFFYSMSYDDDIPRETEQETRPCIPLELDFDVALISGLGLRVERETWLDCPR